METLLLATPLIVALALIVRDNLRHDDTEALAEQIGAQLLGPAGPSGS